ncbi:MAG: DUF4388 domain-containing protein, partial [Vicinamibacteria bacterium]|nr:DUF4388 domain-containing protein [Vicinamibacteria bacterium]
APARDEAHFDKPHVHVRDASTGADTIIDLALPGAPCVVRVVSLESAAPPEGAASAPGAHAIADAPPSSAALPDKLKPANESAPPVFTSEPTSPVSPSLLSFAEAPTAPLKRMTVQSPKTLASISKDPQPLYQGVFPEVLRKLYVGRKTGQLKLSRQREERTLRFWKGNMIHAYSNQSDEQLGEIAVREGLISDFDLACVNDALARADKRVSRVLCELGLLSEKKVEDLLAIQAREVILKVFPWTDGHYIFEEQEPDASWFEELAMKLATPDLILEAVRRIDDPDVVRYQLGNIDRTLHLTTQERLKSLTVNLTALDGYVLSRVDGRLSARQVIEMIPHPPADAQRSLFGLLSIGLIEFTHP